MKRLSIPLAAVIALLFFAVDVLVASGASRDYDEGVYWQTLRALLAGHQLFREVFAPQGPVFFYSLLPIYVALGHAIAAARIGIALFSLLAAAAIFVAAWAVAGRWAGLIAVALLMTDPLWSAEARTLHAEVPALALGLVALALALLAARPALPAGRANALAALSGVFLALGTASKAFVLLFVVAIIGQLLVGRGAAAWKPILFGLAGFVLAGLLIFLPYAGSLQTVYADLVSVHFAAGRVMNPGIQSNIRLLHLSRELVLFEGTAILLLGLAVLRRDVRLVPAMAWLVITGIALLLYHPLFAHEVTLLIPPLAFSCAVALVWLAEWAATPERQWLPGIAAAMLLLFVLVAAVRDVQASRVAARPSNHEQQLAAAIAAHSAPADLVIGDNPYVIALANRNTPPELVDTSFARVLSQAITAQGIERSAQADRVRLFLFDTGRLDGVSGLRSWVAANYPTVVTSPTGGTLYLRR